MKKAIALLTMTALLSMATPVFAADKDNTVDSKEEVTGTTSGYSVGPMMSENQTDPALGYFDITWTPGVTDEIGITINNDSDEDKTFSIDVNKALTNANGALVFNDKSQNDVGKKYNVTELVTFETKEVNVKAGERITTMGKVKFPKEDFNGVVMGGVHVREVKTEEKLHDGEVAMEYSYAFPVILRGNVDDRPEIKISFGQFEVVKNDSSIYEFKTPFVNEDANYLRNVTLDVSVKNDEEEEVYGEKKRDVILTPETSIPLSTLITDPLAEGEYKITLSITHDENTWTETQKVKVSKAESEAIKDDTTEKRGGSTSEEKEKDNKTIAIVIAVIVLGTIGNVIYVNTKKK